MLSPGHWFESLLSLAWALAVDPATLPSFHSFRSNWKDLGKTRVRQDACLPPTLPGCCPCWGSPPHRGRGQHPLSISLLHGHPSTALPLVACLCCSVCWKAPSSDIAMAHARHALRFLLGLYLVRRLSLTCRCRRSGHRRHTLRTC